MRHSRRGTALAWFVLAPLVVTLCLAGKGGKGGGRGRRDQRGGGVGDCPWEGGSGTASERKKAGLAQLQAGNAPGAIGCLESAQRRLEEEKASGLSSGPALAQERGEIGVALGDALQAGGDVEAAAGQFQAVMREFPTSPVPPFKLANQHKDAERWREAVELYKSAIKLAPKFVNARVNMGMAYRGLKELDTAVQCYRDALEHAPERADVHVNLGVALDAAGHPEKARDAYLRAIELDPNLYQAHFNLGVVLFDSLKEREEGIQKYHDSLSIQPNFPDAYHTLGTAHTTMGRFHDAKMYIERAIALRPSDGRFVNSLGILADAMGDAQGALNAYRASADMSQSPAAVINAAKVMNSQARFAEAEQLCFKAIKMDPTYGEAYCQLGDVYKDGEQIQAALEAYQKGIALTPSYDAGFCNYFYTATFACYWEGRGSMVKKLRSSIRRYLDGDDPLAHECVQPFQSLAYPFEPEELLEISRFHANKAMHRITALAGPNFSTLTLPDSHLTVFDPRMGAVSHKLRVGWVSADYKDHPVVKDLVHMFSMFDSEIFDTFCFALNPAGEGVGWEQNGWHDGGGKGPHRLWRDKVQEHCSMVDLSSVDDVDAAVQINQHRIHMLFNIQGYTQGERNEIFALQPASIQVLYKGFVGTLGATYVQYMVSDRIVSPPEYANHYTEKLVLMPHTYVVNDYREWYSEIVLREDDKAITRSNYQLPSEPRVLYCNFNQQYKIDAPTLRAWVQILQAVPGSVLWLIRFGTSDAAETALREHAVKIGLKDAAERIVFTDPVARRLHLHVKSLAHVFLDTPQYNGHGTATDALWATVPIVTFPVRKMASRAAASFAVASGGEGRATLVRNLRDYVQVGIRLGAEANIERLRALREELGRTRFSSPMFDTKRWVRGFQRAARMLWEAGNAEVRHNIVLAGVVPPT